MDVSPYLSVPAALAFRTWLGGEHAINDYCHKLALAGGRRLAALLGTRVMRSPDAEDELVLNMVDVQLPLPIETFPGKLYDAKTIKAMRLAFEEKVLRFNVYAANYFHAGAWWTRCSAQVFNEVSDFEYLGRALNAVCKEVEETILARAKTAA